MAYRFFLVCIVTRSKKNLDLSTEPWARILKRLWSPGIDSKEWIPPAYVAWRASTIVDNPISPRVLAPIDSLKIPALLL